MSSLSNKITLTLIVAAIGVGAIWYTSGHKKAALVGDAMEVKPASITVAAAAVKPMTGLVVVSGTLVPREEVLVGAEAEGLRITGIHADEGDVVAAGQVLADLARDALDAQLAQNKASAAQAQSQIVSAEATLAEATAALGRARTLKAEGYQTQAVLDQREAAAKTAQAQLDAARSNLDVIKAQARELGASLTRRYLKAPVEGIIARRTAKLGQVVSSAAEPLFRIIANGDIELLADVPEKSVNSMVIGQQVTVTIDGGQSFSGTTRIVSPEIDSATRLGRIRVALPHDPALKIGSFARASITTSSRDALAVPSRAIAHTDEGTTLMVVTDKIVKTRRIETGITDAESTEVISGLNEGELVVEKAGTFLRDGDAVAPVIVQPKAQ